jgi:hypothetical protein
MKERDIERICKLLARFSRYTQQFEKENAEHDNQQGKKTETLGTVQTGDATTGATHRRPDRAVSKTVNDEAIEE